MRRLSLFVIAILALMASQAMAQSLGDVAQQEAARRKTVQAPGKVYTNDSLRPVGAPATPTAATPAASANPDKSAAAAAPTDKDASADAQDPKKDQAYWRQRITAERDALSRSQTFAEALQSRINALTTDFVGRDDPFQRNQIAGNRQKALAELDRVQKDIVEQTKKIADTQEEARKAGVPAGWVR